MLLSCLDPILDQFRASNFVNMTLYDPYNNTELELDYSLFVFFAQIYNKVIKEHSSICRQNKDFLFFSDSAANQICVYPSESAAKKRPVSTLLNMPRKTDLCLPFLNLPKNWSMSTFLSLLQTRLVSTFMPQLSPLFQLDIICFLKLITLLQVR